MEDLKKLMEEAVERLRYNGNTDGRGNNALADKIEDALKAPELRINTPNGDLVVGVAENEATQAYVCLDTKEAGLIDLFLAEVPGEELKECYPELEENDMRLLMWEDVFSEDYTTKSVIKAEDIKDLNKTMENASNNRTNNYKVRDYGQINEDVLDNMCADFENLKFGGKMKAFVEDTDGRLLMIEVERNFNKASFANNISKEDFKDGYGDLYKINTSFTENGTTIELEELNDVPITELYSEMAGLVGMDIDMDYEYDC